MSFKTWAIDKKIRESDLIFTRALKSPSQLDLFYRLADQISFHKPTFSEGLQIFEILTDLILMGHHEELFITTDTLADVVAHLKKMRYPVSTKSDESLKSKLESLPWPQGSKIKFERRGDRAGLEIKFFVSSRVDLVKIISSLERVQKELP